MPIRFIQKKIFSLRTHIVTQQRVALNSLQIKHWSVGVTAGVIVLGVIYLGQINSMATRGYELKALEIQRAALSKANKELEVKVAEEQSTANILSKIEALNLVKVSNVSYISATSTSVALAK